MIAWLDRSIQRQRDSIERRRQEWIRPKDPSPRKSPISARTEHGAPVLASDQVTTGNSDATGSRVPIVTAFEARRLSGY